MKSNVPKFDFFEMPLKVFIKEYPDFVECLPDLIDFDDVNYIVRFKDGIVELGYSSDEWLLNQKNSN